MPAAIAQVLRSIGEGVAGTVVDFFDYDKTILNRLNIWDYQPVVDVQAIPGYVKSTIMDAAIVGVVGGAFLGAMGIAATPTAIAVTSAVGFQALRSIRMRITNQPSPLKIVYSRGSALRRAREDAERDRSQNVQLNLWPQSFRNLWASHGRQATQDFLNTPIYDPSTDTWFGGDTWLTKLTRSG